MRSLAREAHTKFAALLRLWLRLRLLHSPLLLLLLHSPLLLLLVKACSCCGRILLLLMHQPECVGGLVLEVCAPATPLARNEKLPPLLLRPPLTQALEMPRANRSVLRTEHPELLVRGTRRRTKDTRGLRSGGQPHGTTHGASHRLLRARRRGWHRHEFT